MRILICILLLMFIQDPPKVDPVVKDSTQIIIQMDDIQSNLDTIRLQLAKILNDTIK